MNKSSVIDNKLKSMNMIDNNNSYHYHHPHLQNHLPFKNDKFMENVDDNRLMRLYYQNFHQNQLKNMKKITDSSTESLNSIKKLPQVNDTNELNSKNEFNSINFNENTSSSSSTTAASISSSLMMLSTSVIEQWLDNKLQTSFKQLNSIIHHYNCKNNENYEIFFINHQTLNHDHRQTTTDQQQQSQQQQQQQQQQSFIFKNNTTINDLDVDDVVDIDINIDIINVEHDQVTNIKNMDSINNNDNVDDDDDNDDEKFMNFIEKLINNNDHDTIDCILNDDYNDQNLIKMIENDSTISCIILKRPSNIEDDDDDGFAARNNDNNNNNNIIYIYPPIIDDDDAEDDNDDDNQSSSKSLWRKIFPKTSSLNDYYYCNNNQNKNSNKINNRLTCLSGMFVTLYDVLIKLDQQQHRHRQSNIFVDNSNSTHNSSQTINDNNDDDVLSISNLKLLSHIRGDITDNKIECCNNNNNNNDEYCLSFVIENQQKQQQPQQQTDEPVIMAIVMPINRLFRNSIDAYDSMKLVAKLIYQTICTTFGGLCRAISNDTNNMKINNFLNKIIILMNLMMSKHFQNHHLGPRKNFLTNSMKISGTFPIQSMLQYSSSSSSIKLPLKLLYLDEFTTTLICKYLNDFNSLDWIDECLKFYKNHNEKNIEQALSEYFVRCLDMININNNGDSINNDSTITTNNNQIFDLLEMELSFFTIIGSCLYYRSMLIKSHLSEHYQSLINNYLYVRSIFAMINNCDIGSSLNIINFIRLNCNKNDNVPCDHLNSKHSKYSPGNRRQTDLFLLILSHGQLIHCTIVEVYHFDRKTFTDFNVNRSNKQSQHQQQQQSHHNESQQLPSSFAFYVFIKESFRLLLLYSNRYNLNEKLQNFYHLNCYYNRFELCNVFDRKFPNLINDTADNSASNNFDNWLMKLNPFARSKNKNQDNKIFTKIIEPITTEYECDQYDSMNNFNSFNDNLLNSTVQDESLSINGSLYSETTIHSTISSTMSTMSYDLQYLSNNQHNHQRQMQELKLRSMKHLTHNLIFYINMKSYYGPNLLLLDDSQINKNVQTIIHNEFILNLTSELMRQVEKLRNKLRSMCCLEMKYRNKLRSISNTINNNNDNRCRSMSKIRTSNIISLKFNSNGQIVLNENNENENNNHNHCLPLQIFIIGNCNLNYQNELNMDRITNEYYCCFLLNESKFNINTNNNNDNRSIISKFMFGSNNQNDNYYNQQQQQQSTNKFFNTLHINDIDVHRLNRKKSYQIEQIDSIWFEFDQLINNISMENNYYQQ